MPLTISVLPPNVEAFSLARVSVTISDQGLWRLDEGDPNSYNLKLPIFPLVWSIVTGLAALDPLAHLPWALVFVTAAVVFPGYLLGLKVARHRGVAAAAALFLAAFGSFLFLTSGAMKESLGLLVFPIVVLLYAERTDPRKRGIAFVLLCLLPFLHHLVALMALGAVSVVLVLHDRRALAQGRLSGREFALDVLTGPAAAIVAAAYYAYVKMFLFVEVTGVFGLSLLVAIVVVLLAASLRAVRPARVRAGRALVTPASVAALVPVLAVGAVLYNARQPIFTGTVTTEPALLLMLPAFVAIAGFGVIGFQVLRKTSNRGSDLVLAMLVASVAFILFGFLRGLDPVSFLVAYRSFDFMDFALAVLAGIGVAVAWRRLAGRRAAQVAVGAVFVAALLGTAPMAWNTQAVFGLETTTTIGEFRALEILASLGGRVTTDQRLAEVALFWFEIPADGSLPLRLEAGEELVADYALVLERWTTVGASQLHPAPNRILDRGILDAFLAEHTILFVSGPPGERVYLVRLA